MKRTTRTTTIKVNGERWKVPRGFGAAYKREAARQIAATLRPFTVIRIVIDMMSLVGFAPTREAVADWSLRKRVEAVVYAATIHARASDNPIQQHPELPWLRNVVPWCGPPMGTGAFSGLSPTEIKS